MDKISIIQNSSCYDHATSCWISCCFVRFTNKSTACSRCGESEPSLAPNFRTENNALSEEGLACRDVPGL